MIGSSATIADQQHEKHQQLAPHAARAHAARADRERRDRDVIVRMSAQHAADSRKNDATGLERDGCRQCRQSLAMQVRERCWPNLRVSSTVYSSKLNVRATYR